MICEWILEGSVLWVVTNTKEGSLNFLEICGHRDLDNNI
jgi:hypothetical protein